MLKAIHAQESCEAARRVPGDHADDPGEFIARASEGDAWLHEVKINGYRTGARIEGGKVRLLTHEVPPQDRKSVV